MPGAATADRIHLMESIKIEEMRFGSAGQPVASSSGRRGFSFPNNGLFSSAVPGLPFMFSVPWASSVSSFFSPRFSSLELFLASVFVADDKTLPYELVREGAGACAGETRPERMLREFIVLSKPWRKRPARVFVQKDRVARSAKLQKRKGSAQVVSKPLSGASCTGQRVGR